MSQALSAETHDSGLPIAAVLPGLIAVDLDGSLIRTDLLHESLLALLLSRPLALLALLPLLFRGKAAFKRALCEKITPDLQGVPLNEELLGWLRERHARGARLLLYSASDESLVQPIAERVGLFEAAAGSDGRLNLSGLAKHDAIAATHGEVFTYVGDSRADLPIWSRCRSAVLVGNVGRLRGRLAADVKVIAEFPSRPLGFRLWRRALRLHQWAKNALIFVPLLLSGEFAHPHSVLLALSTYLINDLFDLPADRRHRSKRLRPLASGELPLKNGLLAVPLLMLAAAAVMCLLPLKFAVVALLYTVVTLAYSMGLKRQPILDLLVLAGLFTVRLIAGIAVIDVPGSPWLLTFSMFFFASLAAIKRFTECDALLKEGRTSVPGRGYRPADAPWLMAMGAASGFASVLVFFIYLVDTQSRLAQFHHPDWLWSVCPILGYWLGRVWLLAARGEMRDDPIAFAVKDRLSLGLGAIIAASVFLAVI
jgi:4-hydroxybenzoate polyprenyltransferase/phosphoserine phosphatase